MNSIAFFICAAYPLTYEFLQAKRNGAKEYLSDLGNYMDCTFIIGSCVMAAVHVEFGKLSFLGKFTMVVVILSAIRRTFNFLRIFSVFSTIVTMMNRVIFQLWKFLTFFAILCVLLSLMYSILGVGNVMVPGDFRLVFYDENEPNKWSKKAPNKEYRQIGMFLGNIAQVLRIGTGDFSIIA